MPRPPIMLLVLASAALFASAGTAQVNQNVWVTAANSVYEVSQTGAVVGIYFAPCMGAVGSCQFRTARDQLGNVYFASLAFYAPGVGGGIRKFSPGGAVTALAGGGFSAICTDSAGDLWWAELNYSSQAQGVVATTVARSAAPWAGPNPSLTLPGTSFTSIEPHPVSGVWVTDGQTLRRMQLVAGSIQTTASLALPSLSVLAADGLGRAWAYQSSSAQLLRIVENAGTLSVDWMQALSGSVENVVVGPTNRVFVHVINPSGLSSLHQFGADGTVLPPTHYPVRLRTIDVDTRGGLWGQYLTFPGGSALLHQDAFGVITVTPLSATTNPFDGFTTHGDTTGATFARLGPPALDSDGDGVANRVEVARGTNPYHPLSVPPVVTIAPIAGSVPPSYTIAYQDSDPTHPGFVYVLACALSASTGIDAGPFGERPTVPLDLDVVLLTSLTAGPPTFTAFTGLLPSGGGASGVLMLPPGTPSGIQVFFAGGTVHPNGQCLTSSNAGLLITP